MKKKKEKNVLHLIFFFKKYRASLKYYIVFTDAITPGKKKSGCESDDTRTKKQHVLQEATVETAFNDRKAFFLDDGIYSKSPRTSSKEWLGCFFSACHLNPSCCCWRSANNKTFSAKAAYTDNLLGGFVRKTVSKHQFVTAPENGKDDRG